MKLEQSKATREHQGLTEAMYREILDVIQTVAKEQGDTLVLYRDDIDLKSDSITELLSKITRRKVLYSDPGMDITDLVLARLNERYKAGTNRVPAPMTRQARAGLVMA